MGFSTGFMGRTDVTAVSNLDIGAPGNERGAIIVDGASYDAPLMVHDIGTAATATCNLHKHSTTAAPILAFSRTNSNTSAHTAVVADQELGRVAFLGRNGTDYNQAGDIRCLVDGTPGDNDMPGRLEFRVSPDGGNTPAVAMTINNDRSIDMPEISDPGAPAANTGRLYMRTTGGKTEFVAIFPSGAVQQIAIEP